VYTCVYILCDFLWPEVQPHSGDSQMLHVLRVHWSGSPHNVVHFLVRDKNQLLCQWLQTLIQQLQNISVLIIILLEVWYKLQTYHFVLNIAPLDYRQDFPPRHFAELKTELQE